MSRLFSIVDGVPQDWSWKRRVNDTVFYIGDKVIGQLFQQRRGGWSAVHRLPSTTGGPVHGFRSRTVASVYLDQIERMHAQAKNLPS